MAGTDQARGGGRAASGRRVVLVGAGHAHLYTLKRAAAFARRGIALTVVAPEDFAYSGVATGVLGETYPPEYGWIDIARLLAGTGASIVRARLAGLDLAAQRVRLDDGRLVPFDVLSLNLGSAPPPLAGAHGHCFDVKPVANLHRLRMALRGWQEGRPGDTPAIAVVGGGMTGVEVAAGLARLARATGTTFRITLYASGAALPDLPGAASRGVVRTLARAGIEVLAGNRVASLDEGHVVLADGRTAPADVVVNATGLRPAAVAAALALPTDAEGAIIVDAHLASIASPRVFAAGDCIAFRGKALPRVGVYAIRQAPVLFRNILATLEGRACVGFRPQARYLTIANLGDDTGLAVRGALRLRGRLAWRLKNAIDANFLAEYRPAQAPSPAGSGLVVPTRSEP